MELTVVANDTHAFGEGPPGVRLLETPDAVVGIIEACFNQGVRAVLLYAENLSPGFFDLSSGEAGTILQKLRNYHIQIAIVLPPAADWQSTNFRVMMIEENRGSDFRLFPDRAPAAAWLLGE